MIVAMALAALMTSASNDQGDLAALRGIRLPHEVREFIERRMGCNHWTTEAPYDRERALQIAAAVRELKCRSIAREERVLRGRYAHSPEVLHALTISRDFIY